VRALQENEFSSYLPSADKSLPDSCSGGESHEEEP
jgi:hypothetical protein